MTSAEIMGFKDLRIHDKSVSEETNISTMWDVIEESDESLKVLDPDDPLMKRFQESLKTHLMRINEKLTKDVEELRFLNKETSKKREEKGLVMYNIQQALSRQQNSIEKYNAWSDDLEKSREAKEIRLHELKEIRNHKRQEYEEEKNSAEKMNREVESTSLACRKFSEYEEEIHNHLAVTKRMSEKDARVQREMIRQKQEADYILLKTSEEVWRLEREIDYLSKQIEVKENERIEISQTIADADADLEGLNRERNDLMDAWNGVIGSISKRDKYFSDLSQERLKMRESFKTMQAQLDNVKKATVKEMETNEKLTVIKSQLEEEIKCTEETTKASKDQLDALEYKTNMIIKFVKQSEIEYTQHHKQLANQDRAMDQELDKIKMQKNILETDMLSKFEDRLIQDKTMKSLTKSLRETRELVNKLELSMLQAENDYGKSLLDFERSSNDVNIRKEHLEELVNANVEREKQLSDVETQMERYNSLIDRKQKQLAELNQKIDTEVNKLNGEIEQMSAEDVKMMSIEKSIEDVDANNQVMQHQWLRQEANLARLTQEQATVLEEVNRLSRQIMIMEQKNLKLENSLQNETKTEKNIDKRMENLHQRLLKTNSILAEQKEMKNNLQDKNFFTRDEFMKKLQAEETDLIKLQNNIKDLAEEKYYLEDKLRDANQEFLSWEKKVKLATETAKMIKDEQNPGGEVNAMKSEIHRMEMRLSHLRKAQEKMIKDMEQCVTRREMMVDAALAREKKNPRETHNKHILFEKRMDGRRTKIKQISKENKNLANKILDIQINKAKLEAEIEENKKSAKEYEYELAEIDKQIRNAELMRHHKLECLVRKQRKMGLLQKVRDKKYKMFYKSEAILNEEFERQKTLNTDLVEILEETSRDFPLLKENIRKILLTIQLSS